ncbi:type II secretion system F family protein [Acidaminobacterium chupaoyuni]
MGVKKEHKQLSSSEIAVFCTQIGMILKAGISLREGMAAICADMQEGQIKDALKLVDEQIQQGAPLEKAMESAGIFPDYVVHMTAIGDATGKLEQVMGSLAQYYEREQALRGRLRSAVLYPMMLFCMMAAVILVLVTKVLPVFENIFRQLGGELGNGAGHLMRFGMIAGRCAFVLMFVIILAVAASVVMMKTKKGRAFFQNLSSKSPFTRKLSEKIASRRFASAMALMLSSGMNIDEAFEFTIGVLGDETAAKRVADSRKRIQAGASFSDALEQAGVFPELFSRMVNIGFKTGSVDQVMDKLADLYEEDIDTSIANITSVIEPVLVGILSVIIGAILISVMLPLTGIMSSIG